MKLFLYLKLLRVKHYIKNFFVFIPLFFSGSFFEVNLLLKTINTFIIFSIVSSIVYILNDIKDVESDRIHEVKRARPIASGRITISQAYFLTIFLLLFLILLIFIFQISYTVIFIVTIYLFINFAYSNYFKSLPIFEIFIIALGFLLRLIAGSLSTNIEISNWLFLTVLSIALFLATGKRRNEFIHVNNSTNSTRRVLKHYSLNFLDSFMNVFLTMIVIFYSLWTIQVHPEFSNNLVWSVPIVLFIVMKYSLILDGDRHGDPTDLLLSNKVLIFSILFFTLYVFGVFYI